MLGNRIRMIGTLLVVATLLTACSKDEKDSPEPGSTASAYPNTKEIAVVEPTSTEPCAPEADAAGYMRADALREGMFCVVGLYSWPASKVPDRPLVSSMVSALEGSETAHFESGYHYMRVSGLNTCAWSEFWLEARDAGDEAQQQRAMDYLTSVSVDPVSHVPGFPANAIDQSVTQSLGRIYDQAEQGDASLMQEYVSRTCGTIDWPQVG